MEGGESQFGTRCPKNNHLRPGAQLILHKQEIVAARSKLWRVCSHEIVLIIQSLMSLMNETIRIKFLLQIYRWAQRTRGKTYENKPSLGNWSTLMGLERLAIGSLILSKNESPAQLHCPSPLSAGPQHNFTFLHRQPGAPRLPSGTQRSDSEQ